jgi:hypothetical protein
MSSSKPPFVYILRLRNCRFYVGVTDDLSVNYYDHVAGTAAEWTRIYHPVSYERIIPNCKDVVRYVKEYMATYSIESTRGAPYEDVELSEEQKQQLLWELYSGAAPCIRCNYKGHTIWECAYADNYDERLGFNRSTSDETDTTISIDLEFGTN